ncbi:sulfotransferase domain-containing protein [Candidatus Dojkabacteria bacterium]|uniref:Sulfotransferase domain-containing protein n=1 Tax=Candidatus Dojkabacteria bacterium TaxID=2099670 RepID=A0A955I8Z0_9BACT|nr:sulfotransferase domain-containing protein [Candidatus Dojkabacteria bacterium]
MKDLLRIILQRVALVTPKLKSKPILVTGIHRSGTTFVGTVLAQSRAVGYVYEPLNPEFGYLIEGNKCKVCNLELNKWFISPSKENQKFLLKHLKHLINAKTLLGKIPVFKSPFGFFLTEMFVEEYQAQIIMMIRNPLGFVSSIKRKNWEFDFNNFKTQPELLDLLPQDYRALIEKYADNPPDIIDQGILLWNIFYRKVFKFQKEYPDWIYLKQEDVSTDSTKVFEALFDNLGLDLTQEINQYILENTDSKNPIEEESKIIHSLKRNSKELVHLWKERLTDDEVERILKGTKNIGKLFYPDLY